MQLPLYQVLTNGMNVELDYMHPNEHEVVRALLNNIIIEGTTYPQKQPLSSSEFTTYWINQDAFVVRLTQNSQPYQQYDILGAFFIKPNFPGRCSHICNAGFIVQRELRGQGIGRLMGEAMVAIATDLGYQAVMFNLVFETNIASLRLWESLGFETIGRIPEAVQLDDGKLVDALMLYRNLRKAAKN